MKRSKKMIAMLLVLVMCVGLFPIVAMADEPAGKEPFNVVVFGSKTATGFGLSDYGQATRDGTWTDRVTSGNGCSFGVMDNASESSYVRLMKNYLNTSLLFQRDVKVKNLAFEGMRADELHALLDTNYKVFAQERGDTYLKNKLAKYKAWFEWKDNNVRLEGKTLENYTQDAVMDADVIILDFAMENFYSYLSQRVQAILGLGGSKKDFSEKASDLGAQLGFDVAGIETTIKDMINLYVPSGAQLPEGELEAIIEALVYCYCDFRMNFNKDLELIRDLNKTAKIIVVGGYNALNGLKLDFAGQTVDMSSFWLSLTSLVNTYITTGEHANNYFYANVSSGANTFFQDLSVGGRASEVSEDYALALAEQAFNYNSILGISGSLYVSKAKELSKLKAAKAAIEALENPDMEDYQRVCSSISSIENNAGFIDAQQKAQTVVESCLKAAKLTSLDFVGAREIIGRGKAAVEAAVVKAAFDWNNATAAQKALLYLDARFIAGDGMGICPNETGCRKAYDAVKSAYTKVLPASTDKEGNIIGTIGGAFSGILQVFKTPILQVVSNLFQNFSFDAMFTAIRDRVSNWIVTVFPRLAG